MTVEEAARFLTEQGIPTICTSLYNLVYKNTVPYRKFGSVYHLLQTRAVGMDGERMTRLSDSHTQAAMRIAVSARNKSPKIILYKSTAASNLV